MHGRQRAWIAGSLLLFAPILSGFGQDMDSAKHFVESLYGHYTSHGKGIDFSGPKGLNYFTPSLNNLIDADARAVGPNEVGVLDGDPICSCQDWDGIYDLKIRIRMLSTDHAKAAVSFALFAPKAGADRDWRSVEMTLTRRENQWRIDDILDQSDPKAPFDLRAELEKETRSLRRTAKPDHPR